VIDELSITDFLVWESQALRLIKAQKEANKRTTP